MYRIIDNRGTGKTSRLLLLAKENGYTVVCRNPRRLIEKAHVYGIKGVKIISYEDLNYDTVDDFNEEIPIVIDELEDFVKYLLNEVNLKLGGYTLSLLEH